METICPTERRKPPSTDVNIAAVITSAWVAQIENKSGHLKRREEEARRSNDSPRERRHRLCLPFRDLVGRSNESKADIYCTA